MVQIIQKETPPIEQTGGAIKGMFQFFYQHWRLMLVAVFIFILGIVVYYLFKKLEDERRERDEPGYQLYKSTVRTCILQARAELIRKHWNPKSLLLLFIPVAWPLIPFIKTEHSAKVVDRTNQVIGYYRGEFTGMDNSYNLLVYKKRYLFFFEDRFLIKIPLSVKYTITKRNRSGEIERDNTGKPKTKITELKLESVIRYLPNDDIKLLCISIERIGLYYYCPVVVDDSTGVTLDFRQHVEGAIIDNTYQLMVQRLLNLGAKQMEKGMMFNPHLQFAQKSPEKTKTEERMEDVNP